jgi:hypothetical protein
MNGWGMASVGGVGGRNAVESTGWIYACAVTVLGGSVEAENGRVTWLIASSRRSGGSHS